MEATITTLIGLVGGLLLSAVFWYWLTHVVSPRAAFSAVVSRITDTGGEPRYRVKVTNPARRRDIIDLSYVASIEFPGMRAFAEEVAARPVLPLELSKEQTFRISARGYTIVAVSLPPPDALARTHVIRALYPEPVARNRLTIERVLADTPGAYLRLQVLRNDGWSGARKYFSSPHYMAGDVVPGDFAD